MLALDGFRTRLEYPTGLGVIVDLHVQEQLLVEHENAHLVNLGASHVFLNLGPYVVVTPDVFLFLTLLDPHRQSDSVHRVFPS